MTAARRTLLVFTALWLPLVLWQYARSAVICADGSAWNTAEWALLLLMCALPVVEVRRVSTGTDHDTAHHENTDTAVRMLLIAYVPLALALRLAELCGVNR